MNKKGLFLITMLLLTVSISYAQVKDLILKGTELEKKGKYKKALIYFKKALFLNPTDDLKILIHIHRGTIYENLGKLSNALKEYDEILKINPKYSLGFFRRAGVFEKMGRWQEALLEYSKAIKYDPKRAIFYYNRGTLYIKRGMLQKGISDLTKAIALKPNFKRAYYNRGVAFYKKGEYKNAILDLKKALGSTNDGYVYSVLGRCYQKMGDNINALKCYTKAISIGKNPTFYIDRAKFYFDTGKRKEAFSDIKKAKKMAPQNPIPYLVEGNFYRRIEKYSKAISSYQKALRLDKHIKDGFKMLGISLYLTGNYSNALKSLKHAVEENPQDPYPYLWIYLCRSHLKKESKRSLLVFEEIFPQKIWPLPVVELFLGKFPVSKFEDALSKEKNLGIRCEGYFYLGEFYLLRKNKEKAKEFFKKSTDTNLKAYIEYSASLYRLKRIK